MSTNIKKLARTAALLFIAGCAARSTPPPPTPEPQPVQTPVVVPTVPPGTPTPFGGTPLPTRPVRNPNLEAAKKAGKVVGPQVTFVGIARADGRQKEADSVDAKGIPVFVNYIGSGFILVVEGKPGISNLEVGRRVFAYDPNDPSLRPDLEIQVDQPLGDGSEEVCDNRRPRVGGIPAINPPSFAATPKIAATLNDFSCRFETFIESTESCTLDKYGDYSFVRPESSQQFCMVVARAWNFPMGDTLVSVRLRDSEGSPGPVSHFILRRTKRPTPTRGPARTPTPTISRRRP